MDGQFKMTSRIGHRGEHMFMLHDSSMQVYTCVCNGWRVFVWALIDRFCMEAYTFLPGADLEQQFLVYEGLEVAEEAGVKVMRAPKDTTELTMCALIYELCAEPNRAGLQAYPDYFLDATAP